MWSAGARTAKAIRIRRIASIFEGGAARIHIPSPSWSVPVASRMATPRSSAMMGSGAIARASHGKRRMGRSLLGGWSIIAMRIRSMIGWLISNWSLAASTQGFIWNRVTARGHRNLAHDQWSGGRLQAPSFRARCLELGGAGVIGRPFSHAWKLPGLVAGVYQTQFCQHPICGCHV